MSVVIVQSRATAHVVRVFGALVALLLMMAIAVGLLRFRSADHPAASPYGVLGAVAPAPAAPADAAAVVAARTVNPVSASPLPAAPVVPVATADAPPEPVPALPPPPASPVPADPGRAQPRQIALDRAAAGSALPQPAPVAMVAAATRAATAPPAPVAAVPNVDAAAPAAGAPVRAADVAPKTASATGLVNINTASVEKLNAVGAGHVGRTIARHRPYRSLQDLVDHRVLNARDFARIRSAITIN